VDTDAASPTVFVAVNVAVYVPRAYTCIDTALYTTTFPPFPGEKAIRFPSPKSNVALTDEEAEVWEEADAINVVASLAIAGLGKKVSVTIIDGWTDGVVCVGVDGWDGAMGVGLPPPHA
jgi:hypothetical protein